MLLKGRLCAQVAEASVFATSRGIHGRVTNDVKEVVSLGSKGKSHRNCNSSVYGKTYRGGGVVQC